MRAQELALKIKSGSTPTIIDVRSGFEYRSGHIPGAIHAPLIKILFRLVRLPKTKEQLLVVTCEHGPRARLVMSTLARAGYSKLEMLEGHMSGWRQAQLPLRRS
ncbi:MAG TPA: rhodanese-like domain-containing protein [Geopsychrobacteraceae bacterium]|nr:rhodanese-like domain-containing protein [Geopsychrobacteraceae bacterium]